jgi:hypothetical protein
MAVMHRDGSLQWGSSSHTGAANSEPKAALSCRCASTASWSEALCPGGGAGPRLEGCEAEPAITPGLAKGDPGGR